MHFISTALKLKWLSLPPHHYKRGGFWSVLTLSFEGFGKNKETSSKPAWQCHLCWRVAPRPRLGSALPSAATDCQRRLWALASVWSGTNSYWKEKSRIKPTSEPKQEWGWYLEAHAEPGWAGHETPNLNGWNWQHCFVCARWRSCVICSKCKGRST